MKATITYILVLVFSIFVGWGMFDPLGTGGLSLYIIIAVLVAYTIVSTKIIIEVGNYKRELILLFSIVGMFTVADLFYGGTHFDNLPINIKLISAIIIFWVLSYIFYLYPKLVYYSIFVFSYACFSLVVFYILGVSSSNFSEGGGRLVLFGENPNSLSARLAVAFVSLLYLFIRNPLQLKIFFKLFYILPMPFLFVLVLQTGSKGSFIILILATLVLLYFSKINTKYKILITIVIIFGYSFFLTFIENFSVYERLMSGRDISTGRYTIWKVVLDIFYDYPMGTGEAGYFDEITRRYKFVDPHNLFLYVLVCGGALSFILLLLFFLSLLKKSFIAYKNGDVLPLILFCFMLFISAKTGGVLTYLPMWYFFAIVNQTKTSYIEE